MGFSIIVFESFLVNSKNLWASLLIENFGELMFNELIVMFIDFSKHVENIIEIGTFKFLTW